MDSHYQDGRDSQRQGVSPFSEPETPRTLWLVLAVCVVGLIGYKVYTMQSAAMPRPTQPQPPISTAKPPPPRVQPEASATNPPAVESDPSLKVTKCVVNGAATYTDSGCPANAKVSTLTIKPQENIAASQRAVPVSPAGQQAPHAAAVVVGQPAPMNFDQSSKKAECDSLSKAIETIDARARQLLSAQEQDWLAARRKEHRDRQFRIQC